MIVVVVPVHFYCEKVGQSLSNEMAKSQLTEAFFKQSKGAIVGPVNASRCIYSLHDLTLLSLPMYWSVILQNFAQSYDFCKKNRSNMEHSVRQIQYSKQ